MFAVNYRFDVPDAQDQIDPAILETTLSRLSDKELSMLEDDLDFCNFAGVPSPRVLEVLAKVVDLDEGWKALMGRNTRLSVPEAY